MRKNEQVYGALPGRKALLFAGLLFGEVYENPSVKTPILSHVAKIAWYSAGILPLIPVIIAVLLQNTQKISYLINHFRYDDIYYKEGGFCDATCCYAGLPHNDYRFAGSGPAVTYPQRCATNSRIIRVRIGRL
jgi:hypothetical protein